MPEKPTDNIHASVMVDQSVELLEASRGGLFVDATLGLGGHAEAILRSSAETSVIGIDQDADALDIARHRLASFAHRVRIVHSNFSETKSVLTSLGSAKADGILADLGVSSLQLDKGERGFSFRFDAPLDMRMDADSTYPTAAELLETLPENDIANIIYHYGEERFSRRIARWIVEKRDAGEPIRTTLQLAALVERAVRKNPKDRIHPATRTFQALRIAVNREMEVLEKFLVDAVDSLKTEGRLVIITFHSLEDRIVKQAFQKMSGKCFCPPRIPQCMCGAGKQIEILTRKPVAPGEEEMAINPRSRSAKLRAVKKIEASSR